MLLYYYKYLLLIAITLIIANKISKSFNKVKGEKMDSLSITIFPSTDKEYAKKCVNKYQKKPNKDNFFKAYIACCSYGISKYRLKNFNVEVQTKTGKISSSLLNQFFVSEEELKNAIRNPDEFFVVLATFFHEFTHYYINRNNEQYLLGKAKHFYYGITRDIEKALSQFLPNQNLVNMVQDFYYINDKNEYLARKFAYQMASKICSEMDLKNKYYSFMDSERVFVNGYSTCLDFGKTSRYLLEEKMEDYQLNFIDNMDSKSQEEWENFFQLLNIQDTRKVHNALVKAILFCKDGQKAFNLIQNPMINFTPKEYEYIKFYFRGYDFSQVDKQYQKTRWAERPADYIMLKTKEQIEKWDEFCESRLAK